MGLVQLVSQEVMLYGVVTLYGPSVKLLLSVSYRAVCRKHELTQYELEMASSDLISKKQQREELATGVFNSIQLYRYPKGQ